VSDRPFEIFDRTTKTIEEGPKAKEKEVRNLKEHYNSSLANGKEDASK
jgi:hypothetical protein